MMEYVYVVWGREEDDFDSREDWIVAAYPDEETANLHAAHANLGVELDEDAEDYDEQCDRDFVWDASVTQSTANDCYYYVMKVPFVLHPDQYQERDHG